MQVQIYNAGDVDGQLLGRHFRWGVSLSVPGLVITTSDVSYFPIKL
jgi:hypothetical protein